jgi:hypothetical protein
MAHLKHNTYTALWTALLALALVAGCTAPVGGSEALLAQGVGGADDTPPEVPVGTGGAPDGAGGTVVATGGTAAATGGTGGAVATGGGDTGTGGQAPACDKPNRLDVPTSVTVALDSGFYTCSAGCDFTFEPTWQAPRQLDETGLLWVVEDAGSSAVYDGNIRIDMTQVSVDYYSNAGWGVYTIRLDPETWDVAEVSNGGTPDTFYSEPGSGSVLFNANDYAPGKPSVGYLLGDAMWDSLFESAGYCLPE